MDTELALHAYVFLGNAFHTVLSAEWLGSEEEFGARRGEVQALYAKVEPLTPKDILAGVAALGEGERELLVRVGRLWVVRLDRSEAEIERLLGVSRKDAEAVLDAVSARRAG